jgi:hypothetical protein
MLYYLKISRRLNSINQKNNFPDGRGKNGLRNFKLLFRTAHFVAREDFICVKFCRFLYKNMSNHAVYRHLGSKLNVPAWINLLFLENMKRDLSWPILFRKILGFGSRGWHRSDLQLRIYCPSIQHILPPSFLAISPRLRSAE